MGIQIISIVNRQVGIDNFEFVERKGSGHPDTLADELAEELSIYYSRYTKEKCGVVLHHNFDKLSLLGGASHVMLGKGNITKPIRVILNGRASLRFGNVDLNINDLLYPVIRKFFKEKFDGLNPEKDIDIINMVSTQSSPGKTYENESAKGTRRFWFEPRDANDLRELQHLGANDTAIGVGYAPLSKVESAVLKLEQFLNCREYKADKPWLGSDIKIMAARLGNDVDITLCVPQIANYVHSLEEYTSNLAKIRGDISKLLDSLLHGLNLSINLNTRDDLELKELYITAIGSSIESGDEGVVGRGNRLNGLISSNRPYSIEGLAAKNPVYHAGKLYNLLAQEIADKIYKITNKYVEVYLVSQSGRLLKNPWKALVSIDGPVDEAVVRNIVEEGIQNITDITDSILKGRNYLKK
ncbi:MAG: methionine adenosyltransferase [Candidatus Nanoarchaeia archaeon]|nr:methionine adenosyltransferase [Candidatus Nanoarchaeia archaeon]